MTLIVGTDLLAMTRQSAEASPAGCSTKPVTDDLRARIESVIGARCERSTEGESRSH
jgi:hypothetical protein